MLLGSMSDDVTLFSTASSTPSAVLIPTAVEPSWGRRGEGGKGGGGEEGGRGEGGRRGGGEG